jgi:septum formation protein
MKIILASASPRRAELFRQMNLNFEIDASDLTETVDPGLTPSEVVKSLAALKGEDVAKRHSDALLVAADTIVTIDNRILGKPADAAEAAGMLRSLSGKTHEVFSGVWVGQIGKSGHIEFSFVFSERTKVTFSPLTDQEIDYYVDSGSSMDKAGAYGIQDDFGALFIKGITGDYYNVVGFPMNAFYQHVQTLLPAVHKEIFLKPSA